MHKRGSPCQDPAGNRTTRRPPDHCKDTQTAVVWSCLPFIRSGQNHFARHSEKRRRQDRQRKRWEGNIREWRGLEFGKSQRAVENREKWTKLAAKSSVVPQWPSRLRDRWWWWWWWWWWPSFSTSFFRSSPDIVISSRFLLRTLQAHTWTPMTYRNYLF